MMPNGSRHVTCARTIASRKSAAVNSSQCTESLLCGGDCDHRIEAQNRFKATRNDLDTGPPRARRGNGSVKSNTWRAFLQDEAVELSLGARAGSRACVPTQWRRALSR